MSFYIRTSGYKHKFRASSNALYVDFIDFDEINVGTVEIILNQKEATELIDVLNNHKKW